ncbi:hypothetical protein [Rhizobium lentis]|uniref:Uncharacterized protein n=1 Tax=Rhizobium lentis TaxID=1138194 RepID=A0A9Q3ME07_9HYPH|nr:hypothetical protein [Rhizobium lentis]MBX4959397.1 hypothetical protein [Rhizobium lentis]MBX4977648.1 hypothetical protein [Rhizobium lentis]MBX4989532.1 hypothetical protein [Rhizobium lentis]MBX4999204.1 hypothetical protein [Rhizobium lentis]MBX5007852.1 hypothetical protein [Rhizobium lentis]
MTGKAAACKHFVPARLLQAIRQMHDLSKFKACPHRFGTIAAVRPDRFVP